MRFVIDTDKLQKYDLTLDELLYLIALSNDAEIKDATITNCHNKGLIIRDYNPLNGHLFMMINKAGTDLLEEFFADSEIIIKDKKDRFELLAIKLRELFPAGKKEGTNYYWRDSIRVITNKLKAVTKQYGEFTDEQAIDATKRYVESFNGNYTYMQLLKYFISKKEAKNGELVENSQLMSYIENAGQDNYNNNWTAELK